MLRFRYPKFLVLNRNAAVVFSVAAGIFVGELANTLKFLIFSTLALTMALSISGTSLLQL